MRYFNHAIVSALSDLNTFSDSHKAHILNQAERGRKRNKGKVEVLICSSQTHCKSSIIWIYTKKVSVK